MKSIIVVGAGIIGAAFAWQAASSGARVLLIDKNPAVGGEATQKSWAWLNASWGNPEAYFRLRQHSLALWRGLDRDVPGLAVNWCGSLLWDLPEAQLRNFVKQHSGWGYDVQLVDGSFVRAYEPNIRDVPPLAAHAPNEGMVEPLQAVQALVRAAEAKGAEVLRGVRVSRLVDDGGRITGVMTPDGVLEADDVVLACGVDAATLLQPLGFNLALDAPAGLLVHSAPAPELLRGLVLAPELHVRQTPEGRLVAGSDFAGADPGLDPEAAARALYAKVQALVSGAEKVPMEFHTTGYRPTPRDGVSAIGRIDGLNNVYLCVTHSGMTLAPALARLGMEEILTGTRHVLLAPFGPMRLIGEV